MRELFRKEEECCGCMACKSICPKGAIRVINDPYGYCYPKIDEDLCVDCRRCLKICPMRQQYDEMKEVSSLAVKAKEKTIVQQSSSGGVFGVLAEQILKKKGVVFGAVMNSDWTVCHRPAESLEELKNLQGSKYVQSNMGDCYQLCSGYLNQGREVLYVGTPCQIAGLKRFLGGDSPFLHTIDLICHGVPGNQMFQDYMKHLENRKNIQIIYFCFRDKRGGWNKNGSITYVRKGRWVEKKIYASESSYYHFFDKGILLRKSCYNCPFAGGERQGDLTIGDFWGIETALLSLSSNKIWNQPAGISCVLVNTDKGERLVDKANEHIYKYPCKVDRKKQGALKAAVTQPLLHEQVMEAYRKSGYEGVEKIYRSLAAKERHMSRWKAYVPDSLKILLKRYVSRQ